ncbi:MAG: sugar phosphate isomerase/epimerase family protein [Turicibacter sp.]
MTNIGVQLYTVKDACGHDFFGTLEAVAKMGYDGVEFAGYYGKSATEIKAKLDELGLKVAGSHIQYEQILNHTDETIEFEKTIGNTNIVCPWATFESKQEWEEFFAKLNVAGQKIKEAGLQLVYHNHAHEFETVDNKAILELMLEATDTNCLKLELDTYWTEFAKINTIDFMKKHADRLVLVHLKDMKLEPTESTEIGHGILPIASFINNAPQVKWFIVEQEAFDKNPLESIEISVKYLKEII